MMEGGRQVRDKKKPACAAEYQDEFFTSYEYLMKKDRNRDWLQERNRSRLDKRRKVSHNGPTWKLHRVIIGWGLLMRVCTE
jgi:hypothetical protein